MSPKTRTLIEAVVFMSFSVVLSTLTVFGAAGIDPATLNTTSSEVKR